MNPRARLSRAFCFVGSHGRFLTPEKPQRRSPQQSTPASIGSGAACFPVAPGANGQQKEENSMYTTNQITIIGFTGSDAEAHYTQNVSMANC